jgi:predicted MFS family arabinose efflux permease
MGCVADVPGKTDIPMTRSLWFVHVMLVLAMMGVGGIAGTILSGDPLDQSHMTQLWLAAVAFGALAAASLTTSFILSKAGFYRSSVLAAIRHAQLRG